MKNYVVANKFIDLLDILEKKRLKEHKNIKKLPFYKRNDGKKNKSIYK